MGRRRLRCWTFLLLLLAVSLAAGAGAAAPPGGTVRAPAADGREASLVELLVELLAAGTTPDRAVAGLGALAKLADPRGFEAAALYAGHRRPEVRREAVRVLGAVNEPRTTAMLLERLGDEASEVRAAAAELLAARQEPRAVPRLMLLVKRNDPVAAVPLGRLATPEVIGQLRERQGAIVDGVLAVVLGTYVKRPEVGDGARLDIVRTLGGLRGAEATAALRDYLASIPERDNRASRREAQRLIDDRGDR